MSSGTTGGDEGTGTGDSGGATGVDTDDPNPSNPTSDDGSTGLDVGTSTGDMSATNPTGIALDDDGGCNCSTTRSDAPLRDLLVGLFGFGLLGLRRRRR